MSDTEDRSPMEGWIRSDSLSHLYKLDRKIQALSKKCNEVQAELSLAKVDQQRLCTNLRAQNETIKDVQNLMLKGCKKEQVGQCLGFCTAGA